MPPNQNNKQNQKSLPDLDPETIKAIVVQQGQKLQLEANKIRLEEKRLEQDGKLAERSIDMQSQLLKDYPAQQRKTILVVGAVIVVVILIFLLFILYCISQGKENFADKFLTWLSHIAGIVGGFFVGRISSKKNHGKQQPSGPEDAEIVE